MECVILIGLPASGKTSFYRERFAATHDHVSKDLMRNVPGKAARQERQVADALSRGRSVVVDNTNASREDRAPIIEVARTHGASVVGYLFEADAATALRRNRLREGRARVPDVAVFVARKRLQPPSPDEGFDAIYLVSLDEAERSFDVRVQSG